MSEQAMDETANDDRVATALWLENTHAGWTREDVIVERCEQAGYTREED